MAEGGANSCLSEIFSKTAELQILQTDSKLQIARMKNMISLMKIAESEVLDHKDLCSANRELKSIEEKTTEIIFSLPGNIQRHKERLSLENCVSDLRKILKATTEEVVKLDTLINLSGTAFKDFFVDIEQTVDSLSENHNEVLHSIANFSGILGIHEDKPPGNCDVVFQECLEDVWEVLDEAEVPVEVANEAEVPVAVANNERGYLTRFRDILTNHSKPPHIEKAKDTHHEILLTPNEFKDGKTIEVKLPKKIVCKYCYGTPCDPLQSSVCIQCQNQDYVSKVYELEIEKGTIELNDIKFAGAGDEEPNKLTGDRIFHFKLQRDAEPLPYPEASNTGMLKLERLLDSVCRCTFKEDHVGNVAVTLEELYCCAEKEATVFLSRKYNFGIIYINEFDDFLPWYSDSHRVRFNLQPGFKDGKKFKIVEEVLVEGGCLHLTIILSLEVKPHRFYNLVKDNLYINVDVPWEDALLGQCPDLKFLDYKTYKFCADQGKVIANDSIWEIPRKGMTENGNLYIKFSVTKFENARTGEDLELNYKIARLLLCDVEQMPEDAEKVSATIMS